MHTVPRVRFPSIFPEPPLVLQHSPGALSVRVPCTTGRLQTSPKNYGGQDADMLLVAPCALLCISVTEVTKDFTVLQSKDYIDSVKGGFGAGFLSLTLEPVGSPEKALCSDVCCPDKVLWHCLACPACMVWLLQSATINPSVTNVIKIFLLAGGYQGQDAGCLPKNLLWMVASVIAAVCAAEHMYINPTNLPYVTWSLVEALE